MRRVAAVLLLVLIAVAATPVGDVATPVDDVAARVEAAMSPVPNVEALRAIGPRALPHLVRMYRSADEDGRAPIAETFYQLGWKSPEAKAALMEDVHTPNRALRLQVQWALGRVSDDPDVVFTLADIMQRDDDPVFRDKAACALAYDQIHLSEIQKVRLYEQVIKALRDPKPDVRRIAATVLKIQLGQTKGYDSNGPVEEREKAVRAWERWLAEYASNL
jgi:HEAT repeat protein